MNLSELLDDIQSLEEELRGYEAQTRNRVELTVEETSPSQWTLREAAITYN